MPLAVGDQVRVVGVWRHGQTGKLVRIRANGSLHYYVLLHDSEDVFKADELELIPPVLAEPPAPGCIWVLDDADKKVYATSCGESWILIAGGGPRENGMRYCPFCGKRLEAVTHE